MTARLKPLHVELLGISPHNKGALLMLEAIRAKFRQELPNARLALPFDWPAERRLAYGMYATNWQERGRLDKSALIELLPQPWRQRLGFWSASEVDVVLDASGFAYGDYWGLAKLQRRLGRVARQWKTGSKTLVLLPQAFGPFEGVGMAGALHDVLRKADLVYVRDRASLRHVQAVDAHLDHVRLSPDFTNLLDAELPERWRAVRGAVLLVPNEKMVAGRGPEHHRSYLDFLQSSAEQLATAGRRVLLLVHEGEGDRRLVRALNDRLASPLDVVDEPSPLVTKAIMGASYATVSSRFHGLVSALSAGVPSAACGWTHKYRALMADYDCSELDIDLSCRDSWAPTLDLLLQAARSDAFRAKLVQAGQRQRDSSEEMWSSVFGLLRHRHPAAA